MTNDEIKQYFAGNVVYKFMGSERDLLDWQQQSEICCSYIIVADQLYVVGLQPINDPRAIVLE